MKVETRNVTVENKKLAVCGQAFEHICGVLHEPEVGFKLNKARGAFETAVKPFDVTKTTIFGTYAEFNDDKTFKAWKGDDDDARAQAEKDCTDQLEVLLAVETEFEVPKLTEDEVWASLQKTKSAVVPEVFRALKWLFTEE